MNISSLSDLTKVANKIKDVLLPGDCIFLYGEIGVGKTTFTRLLINNYELENNLKKSEVLSPTFNIVYEYEVKNFNLKHYDFYRFKNEQDINNVGLFENSKNSITLIEWPELIKNKPKNRIDLFFKYSKDMKKRSLIIKSSGRLKKHEFRY
jgi:tRNA threonylcarbamoyladenosine biosynthesis protein TsaE